MGCQKNIAKTIRGKKEHYIPAVKANQGNLYNTFALMKFVNIESKSFFLFYYIYLYFFRK